MGFGLAGNPDVHEKIMDVKESGADLRISFPSLSYIYTLRPLKTYPKNASLNIFRPWLWNWSKSDQMHQVEHLAALAPELAQTKDNKHQSEDLPALVVEPAKLSFREKATQFPLSPYLSGCSCVFPTHVEAFGFEVPGLDLRLQAWV